MSKRPRAARSNKRSRPQSAPSSRPAASRPTASAESAIALATIEAEPQPQAPAAPRSAPTRPQSRPTPARPSGLLTRKASEEYVYVARDLRRIGAFAGSVAVFLGLVWVLVDLLHVVAV